ncbi:HD-GYP domain-containing protein [Sporosarcina sp. JAI121]|uniref:HD-GYP domain-containing protein n=1 Tax=Sporosarcina sp. JAI121 TaxID=2723064 RepID=UPI0015C79A9A|nr:HD-GYP domain-containing protein [Sporosarcina sp. JAI121]NYF25531.1 HD-GYP domain-containing protein (c-di-GMP phosphodiesterase class II) [Sporosarcina sp. JAI121]
MTETYIKASDLRPGIVIDEDIFANTIHPIIRKNTELSLEQIEVLHAFSIKKVKVNVQEGPIIIRKQTDGAEKEDIIDRDEVLATLIVEQADLQMQYKEAVHNYKKEFLGWCAGVRPDIAKVRSIVIPLLETFNEQKKMITILNDLSTPKDYIYHHSIAVGVLASAISMQIGFPRGQILQLGLAGTLADCGMAKIDMQITEKAVFLTKNEFNEVKKHPVYSYQMLQDTPLLRKEMKLAIFQHHERLDGSGYPRGDKMEKVSVHSQILAVADVFHAMTSERVYRSKESPFKVIEMIKEEEFGKFDIKIVQALHDIVANISIGSKVQLTNGVVGEVIFVHRDARLRPMVKKCTDGSILDLTINRHLAIEKVLL